MLKIFYKSTVLIALLVVQLAQAEDSTPLVVTQYQHVGKAYPPVLFVTNINSEGFVDKLESFEAFSDLNTKAVGLPIGVRVLKGHRRKQDGTQFTTLMLSASTLGIIPIVSNTEFKVHYDIFVQGKSIAKFKYHVDSTDVNNLWSTEFNNRKTKPVEELFIEHTLPQFLNDLKSSTEAQAVFAEYWEYFGD